MHCGKLFQLAKIRPIDRIYEHEATKFVYKNLNVTSKDQQPRAISDILFKRNTNLRSLRMYDDEAKIKIDGKFFKGQCFFNILDNWNNSNQETKQAGNLFSLKQMLNEKMNNEIEMCKKKSCFQCDIDSGRNYSMYMKK